FRRTRSFASNGPLRQFQVTSLKTVLREQLSAALRLFAGNLEQETLEAYVARLVRHCCEALGELDAFFFEDLFHGVRFARCGGEEDGFALHPASELGRWCLRRRWRRDWRRDVGRRAAAWRDRHLFAGARFFGVVLLLLQVVGSRFFAK